MTQNSEFISKISDWINFNKQDHAKTLSLAQSPIIKQFRVYQKPLFRGCFISPEAIISLQKTKKIKLNKFTSWTKDEKIAKKFISDKKYMFKPTNNDHKRDSIPVIFKKTFNTSEIVVDIESIINFVGEDRLDLFGLSIIDYEVAIDEQEVLVKPITVNKNEIISLI